MGKFESHGASSKHSQVTPRTSNCIGLISNTALDINNYTYYVLVASAMTIRSHFTKNVWYVQSVMVCCPLLQINRTSSLTRPCPNFITWHHQNMSVYCIYHFYIAKLGYAGVYLFFLFLLQNIDCVYSLEPPHRGGSNAYQKSMF